MTAKAEVLKQDARGRLRMPMERREALLDEFEKSGVSAAKFARLVGINYATFAGWAQQRRKDRVSGSSAPATAPLPQAGGQAAAIATAAPLRLLEAVIEEDASCKEERKPFAAAGLVVELPGGCRVQIDSPAQLQMAAELVALVARSLRARC
jgi:transposase-like protein